MSKKKKSSFPGENQPVLFIILSPRPDVLLDPYYFTGKGDSLVPMEEMQTELGLSLEDLKISG